MRKFHLSISRDISISADSRDQARGSPSAPRERPKSPELPQLEHQHP